MTDELNPEGQRGGHPEGQSPAGTAPGDSPFVEVEVEAFEHDLGAVGHDVDELLARVQDAEAKHDQVLDDLRRVAADFDNYRKRMAREHERLTVRASERVVAKLLPVLDDLERALEAAEQHEEAKVLDGVRMTRDALASVLASEGVEEIAADGPFDPHVHEALLTQPAGEVESGAIVQVLQRGYRQGDVVLRPTRVVVAE